MARNVTTGLHAIEESLRRGVQGSRLLVSGSSDRLRKLKALAEKRGVPIESVGSSELARVGGPKARGAVLVGGAERGPLAPRQRTAELAPAVDEIGRDHALVLLLDGITDPHNLGAVIRSADQFAVDLVILPERRSAHLGDTVARTSAGADRWVRTVVAPNVARALELLKDRGYWVYGADRSGRPAHELPLSGKVALVLGREGDGLHRLVRERCDELVAIPTGGHIDSLNVSVAAGILLYEARRQQGFDALRPR